jgi:hypothetical protein
VRRRRATLELTSRANLEPRSSKSRTLWLPETAAQFAEAEGVRPGTLTYWDSRLKREADGKPSRIRRPEPAAHANGDSSSQPPYLELQVGDRYRIRLARNFDVEDLVRLLVALEDEKEPT